MKKKKEKYFFDFEKLHPITGQPLESWVDMRTRKPSVIKTYKLTRAKIFTKAA